MKEERIREMIRAAQQQIRLSYAPYSQFHVAAALLCKDGHIVTGCNVENASYPAGNCAERTAVFKAISEGEKEFEGIVIMGGKNGIVTDYCPPCGICRQVLREFTDPNRFEVILAKSETEYQSYLLNDLLPMSFGPDNL